MRSLALDPTVCNRALDARDARFDGLFFVGITTTGIYCRPVCPARISYPMRRRFFDSAAAAEEAGFRPCLRCRPELAPGCAQMDAVPRLAHTAASRIAAGALNGRGVGELANELGVGERQLRRAMEKELGVSPVALAQTHRLLLAKCLLTDTPLPVTQIAFASGFQSLRRFNAVFRERYRLNPSALRQQRPVSDSARPDDLVHLTLGHRLPLAWDALVTMLRADATPGVELIEGRRYARTAGLDGHQGLVVLEHAGDRTHVSIDVSVSLLPALMPLLARLRQLLDLNAEPVVIDAHLAGAGLAELVSRLPGLRVPGVFDGFEFAVREVIKEGAHSRQAATELAGRVTEALGEPIETGIPALNRLGVTAERIADAGASALAGLGVPRTESDAMAAMARAVAEGKLQLEPGAEVPSTLLGLTEGCGVDERTARTIILRALHWPDAFPAAEPALQRAAGVASERALLQLAEQWRPWRAYAATHLRFNQGQGRGFAVDIGASAR